MWPPYLVPRPSVALQPVEKACLFVRRPASAAERLFGGVGLRLCLGFFGRLGRLRRLGRLGVGCGLALAPRRAAAGTVVVVVAAVGAVIAVVVVAVATASVAWTVGSEARGQGGVVVVVVRAPAVPREQLLDVPLAQRLLLCRREGACVAAAPTPPRRAVVSATCADPPLSRGRRLACAREVALLRLAPAAPLRACGGCGSPRRWPPSWRANVRHVHQRRRRARQKAKRGRRRRRHRGAPCRCQRCKLTALRAARSAGTACVSRPSWTGQRMRRRSAKVAPLAAPRRTVTLTGLASALDPSACPGTRPGHVRRAAERVRALPSLPATLAPDACTAGCYGESASQAEEGATSSGESVAVLTASANLAPFESAGAGRPCRPTAAETQR